MLEIRVQELPRDKFKRTWASLEAGVAEGVAPGFAMGFYRLSDPSTIRIGAIGIRRQVPSPQPMTADTVFDLASVSKVVATSTLAALMVERGWISWDTSVTSLIPEYPHRDIKISHLLAHTAGLPAWKPLFTDMIRIFGKTPIYAAPIEDRQKEMRKLVVAVQPEFKPQERSLYSDISFLLLGFALEEAMQLRMDHAVPQFLWSAMGIGGLHYRPVKTDARGGLYDEAAATELDESRGGVLQGQVHDENCWAMGGYGGHAGVFGRVEDVLRFSASMLNGFIGRPVMERAWSRVAHPPGCDRTLGWDTPSGDTPSSGHYFSSASVGHLGFTGTSLWIDPRVGLAVTLLSNRVHPTRDNIKIREFRPKFHDALREDLAGRG